MTTTSTPWRKLWSDLRRERTISLLVVAAIALGLASFGTVLSSFAVLGRELNRGYLDSLPASATLFTSPVDAALLAAVSQHPEIAAAEARRAVFVRVKTGPAEWRRMLLFVIADFERQKMSLVASEEGAWPPALGEVLLERDAFQVAKARLGDKLTVEMSDGSRHSLVLTGRVHDVGQAQARMENMVYGYITPETLVLLGEEPRFDQLKILTKAPFERISVERVAAEIQTLVEATGRAVTHLDVPAPGAHPHAGLMNMLLVAMSSFGLLVLFLAAILVFHLLTTRLAREVRQIGVMKAIGGSRRQIAAIYLGQALLLGVAALALALPVGWAGARLLSNQLAHFLNFNLSSQAAPAWVYGLVVATGLLTPLLAGAWPVARGTAVPVRVALADFGVGEQSFGGSWLDRALTGVRGFSRPLLLSVRNSFRRRGRAVASLFTLTVAGIFFSTAFHVRASFLHTLDRLFASRPFHLAVALREAAPLSGVEQALAGLSELREFEGWWAADAKLGQDRSFTVLALPENTQMLRPQVTAGRGFEPGDQRVLLVNSVLARRYPELAVGQTVTLRFAGKEAGFEVVGHCRETFSPAVAYAPRAYFDSQGAAGSTNSLRLTLQRADLEAVDRFREVLDPALEAEDIQVVSATSQLENRYAFDQHLLMIYVFLWVMAALIGAVGGLGLATSTSLAVVERRRELALMRAIGATSGRVAAMVVAEAVTLALLAFTLATLAAGAVSRALGTLVAQGMFKGELSFATDPRAAWLWLILSLLLATLASLLPAWRAARRPVAEELGSP